MNDTRTRGRKKREKQVRLFESSRSSFPSIWTRWSRDCGRDFKSAFGGRSGSTYARRVVTNEPMPVRIPGPDIIPVN